MQHRIMTDGPLHSREGLLSEAGYATSLIKAYDRKRILARKWRVKEWDCYLVMNDHFAFAMTVADNGYLGLDSLSLLDFDRGDHQTKTRMVPFPLGARGLPSSSAEGVTRAAGKNYEITIRTGEGKRELYGHMYDFGGAGKPLLFDIELIDVKQDSMVIATPFDKKPECFYYSQKINCLPAEGRVIFGDREYIFSPSASFGTLDWGRGVWPYKNTWYWGSASGMVEGRPFGMNLGYGIGDTSKATENMLFYSGKAHKLGAVQFNVPNNDEKEGYPGPWPWAVKDDAGRLDLKFDPLLDRAADMNFWLLASRRHQVFGRFSGTATLDGGKQLKIQNLTGFLEKVRNKW